MNQDEAHSLIIAIANRMNPRPSIFKWAQMMLWNTTVHPESGMFRESCRGPNARFTQREADAICHQVQMRATWPSAKYESKMNLEDRLDCYRMMLSTAKDFIDGRDDWDEGNAKWLTESIAAVLEESEKRSLDHAAAREDRVMKEDQETAMMVKRIAENDYQIRNLAGALTDAVHRMETIRETHPDICLDVDIANAKQWLPTVGGPTCADMNDDLF
jgi:hypothetical protein